MRCAWQAYLNLMPHWMRCEVDKIGREALQELRLRIGSEPELTMQNENHLLTKEAALTPHQLAATPQIVLNHDIENSFGQWASGSATEERVICSVNTAQAALDLVSAGIGCCVVSEECISQKEGVCFKPLQNWHQALYMCILYDKWLEPPIWGFVEKLVKRLRSASAE